MLANVIVVVIFVALVCVVDFSEFFLDEDTEKLLYISDDVREGPGVEKEVTNATSGTEEKPEHATNGVQGSKTTADDFDDFLDADEETSNVENKKTTDSYAEKLDGKASGKDIDTSSLASQLVQDVQADVRRE